MTKDERMKEIAKASPDFGKRVGYKMCVVDEFHDMKELQEENAELKKIGEEYYDFIQKKNEENWKGDNVVGCLKLKIEQLKAQIEKMKCCFNCKHSRTEYEHCRTDKHEKWEMKEK